jgi:3-oxoacyl-[acyl-carrier protein] reductase
MIDPGLHDKTVLITGANNPRGIGAATARAFAAQGAAVFLTYLRLPSAETAVESDASGDIIAGEIRAAGGQVDTVEANLADPAAIPSLFDQAEAAFGPVIILVNNAAAWLADTFVPTEEKPAALWPPAPVTLTASSYEHNFVVNARAAALMMAEFARRHVARGADWGRMITISTDGSYCFPNEISYGASKHALESYSRSAAKELGRYGITVNIVSPGATQTGWITPELERVLIASTPLPRLGQPEDIADVVVFLASQQARWLTGQTLHVGGGARM